MTRLHRFFGMLSLALVTASSFAACGGLDGRKITRNDEYSAGGDDSGGTPSFGGSESQAGQPNVNPFGGAFDGGGAPMVIDGPPSVIQVDPEDGAFGVELEASVSFLFSEAVDPNTISADSVQLYDGAEPVNGDVMLASDQVATFEPARRLSLATIYTTAVSTSVTDTTSQPLESAFNSAFLTRDGLWSEGMPFVDDPASNWNYYTSTAHIASDARGNTLVVWLQFDGLHARWYRQASGWQEPVTLSAMGASINQSHSVAVSPDGDAFVVWSEYDDMLAGYKIMARRFVGGTWSEAAENVNGMAVIPSPPSVGPHVAFNGARAVVWWNYYVYNNQYYYYVSAQSATIDGAWKEYADTIGYADGATEYFDVNQPLTMDSAGNAMLVFNKVKTADNSGQLQYARFVAATGDWEPSAPIGSATGAYASSTYSVALDDSGNALVVWTKTDGAKYDLMASRYTKAKGFAAPLPLDSLDTEPSLDWRSGVVRGDRGFVVAWRQAIGASFNAYASHYADDDDSWSEDELISDGLTGISGIPALVVDRHGNAMALWPQKSSSTVLYADTEFRFARWLAAAGAWSSPEIVLGDLNFSDQHFQASVAGNGYIGLLSQDIGNYSDRPGQPYLSVFH